MLGRGAGTSASVRAVRLWWEACTESASLPPCCCLGRDITCSLWQLLVPALGATCRAQYQVQDNLDRSAVWPHKPQRVGSREPGLASMWTIAGPGHSRCSEGGPAGWVQLCLFQPFFPENEASRRAEPRWI